MSKRAIKLAENMKESVAEIEKILDDFLRFPDTEDTKKITNDHHRINLFLQKIYNNLQDFSTVLWNRYNVPELDRIGVSDGTNFAVVGDEIYIETCRIPKKNFAENMASDALENAFKKAIIDGKIIPKMPKKHIEIMHVYPSDFPAKAIRDNDNYNYKSIINTICFYTKGSDRGDKCWLSLGTEISEDGFSGTRIRISPMIEKMGRKPPDDCVAETPECVAEK